MIFNDVNTEHWAYKAIEELYNRGLIKGYEDGSFHPDDQITRAEVATILARILKED